MFSSLEGFKQEGRNLAFYCTCGKLDGTCTLILMYLSISKLPQMIPRHFGIFLIKMYLYLYIHVIYWFSPLKHLKKKKVNSKVDVFKDFNYNISFAKDF